MTNLQNSYSEFIKKNKILRHSANGLSHFLILWIIRYNDQIHGYAIMKELDKFFENSISEGVLKKSGPSKIYSILNQMEDSDLIMGQIKYLENKKIKYFSITEKGDYILNYLFMRYLDIFKSPQWKLLLDDFNKKN